MDTGMLRVNIGPVQVPFVNIPVVDDQRHLEAFGGLNTCIQLTFAGPSKVLLLWPLSCPRHRGKPTISELSHEP